ncbi:MAG: DUF47 family protein [Bacillota bacterium]|nr:DUF47 family protein [Bacillota bacterium]
MKDKKLIDKLFPPKYDFYGMLNTQAELSALTVTSLLNWVKNGNENEKETLIKSSEKCDEVRLNMEHDLTEAFSTPFDRQDIYAISIEMDKIVEFAKSTLLAMEAFEAKSDDTIINMIINLNEGTNHLYSAIKMLESDTSNTENEIAAIRKVQNNIEDYYREGMAAVFKSNDAMYALKQREVYHHIKDAGTNLGYAVDKFHRIVVKII